MVPDGRAIDPLQNPLSSLEWGGGGDPSCLYDQYCRIPGSTHLVLNSTVNLQPFLQILLGLFTEISHGRWGIAGIGTGEL